MPSPTRVLALLERLDPVDVVAAATHLLTPATVGVGLQASIAGGVLRWRGEEAAVASRPVGAAVSAIADLVLRGTRPGDAFLTLEGSSATWAKYIRSGAFVHLAGAREVLDAQHVIFTESVPVSAALAIATMLEEHTALTSGTLLLAGHELWVTADADAARVEPL